MTAPRDLASWMAEVATELQDIEGDELTVKAVVEKAVVVVPGATCASVTVRSGRRGHETLAATSPVAEDADALQYELGEGPCVEVASDERDFTRSGDVQASREWPTWGPRAAGLGVGSLLSVPLLSHGERIGALNLYAEKRGEFGDPDTVDLALLYAVHAAHAMTSARTVTNLGVALSSRHTIGVAQGILTNRYGITLEQSFALLRRIASDAETKLALVAHEIVVSRGARALPITTPPPPPITPDGKAPAEAGPPLPRP